MKKVIITLLLMVLPVLMTAQGLESLVNTDTVYKQKELDVEALYDDGFAGLANHVKKNYRVPDIKKNLKTRVVVEFVIEVDGTMSNFKVEKDPGYGLAEQGIAVMKSLPKKWTPGKKDGKDVRSIYKFPIMIDYKK